MQQYRQKPYCVLLFEILQYIAILQYLVSYWLREGVYTSGQYASYAVQKIGFLGRDNQKFHWIALEILAKS